MSNFRKNVGQEAKSHSKKELKYLRCARADFLSSSVAAVAGAFCAARQNSCLRCFANWLPFPDSLVEMEESHVESSSKACTRINC